MRTNSNPAKDGLTLNDLKKLFKRVYDYMGQNDYFDESFYAYEECYDDRKPKIPDVEFEILLKIRKKNLWPISEFIENYSEDDLFDIIEFLHIHVSKPINGVWNDYQQINCWDKFDKAEGQKEFREKINEILGAYIGKFELSKNGEILKTPEIGFEKIFKAKIPSNDEKVRQRINSAIRQYRRQGATVDDRRHAVKDLTDIFELLRPKVKSILTKKDESDLFNIANNFGIRHHNEIQKTDYDANLWLSWMFYFYLATIHLCLRKIDNTKS
jgi:hypothetical protein